MPAQILSFTGQQHAPASPIARYLHLPSKRPTPFGRVTPHERRRAFVLAGGRDLGPPVLRGHGVKQQAEAVSALEKVPDLLRASHFLDGPLAEAERLSQSLGQLRPSHAVADENKVDEAKLTDRMQGKARKRALVGVALRHMHERRGGEWTRSRPIARQSSPGPLFRRGRP